MLESLGLVVDKGANRAAQRNDGNSCGRLKARDHPDQVTEQDEEAERGQERCVAFGVMADDFVALSLDESFYALEEMLKSSRVVHGEARAHQEKKDQQKPENEHLHGQGVWDGSVGVLGCNA